MTTAAAYDRQKERARRRQKEAAASARDIAPIPPVADPARRGRAARSLRAFCEEYQRAIYHLAWSDDHLKAIAAIEAATAGGELSALAMPRGSGKTSLCESAVLWATLTGRARYCVLIGPDEGHAQQNLQAIHAQLTTNTELAADFPEACYPLARLEGIHQRKLLYDGRPLVYEVTKQRVVLPDVPGSKCAGGVIQTAGLTGRIRGMKHARPDGTAARPDLVLIDDPQTDESARSPSQSAARESILAGAVLGLAGPGRKIAGIMPCTVIQPGDMADRILDRQKHPEWNGTRTKMVYAFPDDANLWDEYATIRADGLRAEDGGKAATEFYRQHRAEMDAGSVVAWPERFNPGELSAIQHAINLRLRNERAFFAEYQNDPMPERDAREDDLSADQIAAKVNRLPRGAAPSPCNRVTAFIDVQGSLLFWVACGWEDDFSGYVLDYGSYPDQRRDYYTLRDAKIGLADATKAPDLEGQIYAGLDALVNELMAREWPRDDGAGLKVERLLIDANWGTSTDIVYKFCRQSAHSAALTPSHGKYVGASNTPMAEWPKREGERVGLNWRLRNMQGRRSIRSVIFDSNWWKTFIATRLSVPMGSKSCLSLFGDKAATHRMLADHLTAEYRVRTEGRGRQCDEWKIKPERPDNHWLDGLVGAAVGASMQGVALAESSAGARPAKRRRLTREDFQGRGDARPR